jgi:hypothetical protein
MWRSAERQTTRQPLYSTPTLIVTAITVIRTGSDMPLTLLIITTGRSDDEATHGKWLVGYTRVGLVVFPQYFRKVARKLTGK